MKILKKCGRNKKKIDGKIAMKIEMWNVKCEIWNQHMCSRSRCDWCLLCHCWRWCARTASSTWSPWAMWPFETDVQGWIQPSTTGNDVGREMGCDRYWQWRPSDEFWITAGGKPLPNWHMGLWHILAHRRRSSNRLKEGLNKKEARALKIILGCEDISVKPQHPQHPSAVPPIRRNTGTRGRSTSARRRYEILSLATTFN